MKRWSLALLLALPSLALGQDITIPERVDEHSNVVLEVDTAAEFVEVEAVCRTVANGAIVERYADILELRDTPECTHRYAFTGAPGSWAVTVRMAVPGIKTARATVVIGQAPKPPVDPVVVDPDNPPPIATDKLHVLIVEETADRPKLPASQVAVFTSQKLRDELEKLAPGRWRILDDDVPTAGLDKAWSEGLALHRDSLPWLVVSNGATGTSQALPGSVDEVLQVVRSYAR